MQRLKPELSTAWVAQYGENWREKVAEDIARYNDMGAAAEREKRGPAEPAAAWSFTAGKHHPAEPAYGTEDIVDADVVEHTDADEPVPSARAPRSHGATRAPRRGIDEPVYEGELVFDDTRPADDDDVINGEVIENQALEPGQARAAILAGATSSAPETDEEQGAAGKKSSSAKFQRAQVNQHYNEVETGNLTGIGSDDATPLQDVDFQLG